MTKYNPRNDLHRKWLAERVLKVALAYGFMLDFSDTVSQEMVFCKKVKGFTTKIYTSVDKRSRVMRHVGSDAIRVIATDDSKELRENLRFHRIIHRKGTFKTIGDRLAEALRIANWNVENPDKPRWNGESRGKKRRKSKKYLTKL